MLAIFCQTNNLTQNFLEGEFRCPFPLALWWFIFFSKLILFDKVVCLSIKNEYCYRRKDLLETMTLTEKNKENGRNCYHPENGKEKG